MSIADAQADQDDVGAMTQELGKFRGCAGACPRDTDFRHSPKQGELPGSDRIGVLEQVHGKQAVRIAVWHGPSIAAALGVANKGRLRVASGRQKALSVISDMRARLVGLAGASTTVPTSKVAGWRRIFAGGCRAALT
ncbi:hypothetical protein D9M70_411620 [compost metagenome]